MLKDNLDKYIKENLENARVDWDRNAMWDDIASQLPAKEKDRKGWIFLLGLLLLVVSSVGGYLLTNSNSITDNQNIEDRGYESIVTVPKKLLNSQSVIPSEANSNEKNIEDTRIESNNDKVTLLNESNHEDTEAQIQDTAKVQKEIPKGNKIINVNKLSEEDSQENIEAITSDNSIVLPIQEIGIYQSDLASQKQNIAEQLESIKSIDVIGLGRVEVSGREIPLIVNVPNVIAPQVISNVDFGLGFYSGIGIANRHLETQVNESLLSLREQNESTLEVLYSGLSFRKRIGGQFFVDAAIEYQRINEKLDYTETSNSMVSISSDSAFVATTNSGSSQFYRGNVEATVTRSQRSIRYNVYHSINIPLHIGYSRKISEGFSLSGYTGPVMNVYQNISGYNIDLDGRLVESDIIHNNSLVSAFDAGISLEYALSKRVDLSLGAMYRKALSTFSIDNNVYQSYDNMNLQVGILYNFF